MSDETAGPPVERWYDGITRYQWLVLLIASLGWVFDVFEGQIFVASMREAMPSLVSKEAVAAEEGLTDPRAIDKAFKGRIAVYNSYALGAFLLGGALGGIVFGMLSDRIGRTRTMQLTIAFYSVFTCISAFSQEWWHLAGLRFLVAMGVGGEWAVASAMVAEVFPKRARAHVGGIFHASSVFGTYLAVAAGAVLIGNTQLQLLARNAGVPSLPWRIGFAIGVLPAFLIIWIRSSLREPESWEAARDKATDDTDQRIGSIGELFRAAYLRNTLVGVTLAAVGLATFWGTHVYGKDLLREEIAAGWHDGVPADVVESTVESARTSLLAEEDPPGEAALDATLSALGEHLRKVNFDYAFTTTSLVDTEEPLRSRVAGQLQGAFEARLKRWEMLGMFLTTTGGGIGLVLFGPISQWLGRRGAFLAYHLAGFAAALVAFQLLDGVTATILFLPVFGFLTLGMHAGYAIYFPELFPTRLRGTGAGFCFNAGRILAAPILFLSGWMQKEAGYSLTGAATVLSFLYLLGVLVLLFAPETRGRELPE